MLNKTLVDLSFTSGLNKYAEEVLRSGPNELTNIVFEEDGIVKKHTGDEVSSTETDTIQELYQKDGKVIHLSGIITSESSRKFEVKELAEGQKMPLFCKTSWGTFVEDTIYQNDGTIFEIALFKIIPQFKSEVYVYNDKFYYVDKSARSLVSIDENFTSVTVYSSLWIASNDNDVRYDFKDGILLIARLFDGTNPMSVTNSLFIDYRNIATATSSSSEVDFLPYLNYKDWKIRVLRDLASADNFTFGILLVKNNASFLFDDRSLFVVQYQAGTMSSFELRLDNVVDFEPIINAPALNWYDYSFVYRFYDSTIGAVAPRFKLYSTIISYVSIFGTDPQYLASPIMNLTAPFYIDGKIYFYAKVIDGVCLSLDYSPIGPPYVGGSPAYATGSSANYYNPADNFNYIQNANTGTLANLLNGSVYLYENFKPILKVTSINNIIQINEKVSRPTELSIILPYVTDADSYFCKEYTIGGYRPKVQQINDDSIFSNGPVKINDESMIILNRVPCILSAGSTGGTEKKYRYKIIPYFTDSSGFEYMGESTSYYEVICNIAGPIQLIIFRYNLSCKYLIFRTDPMDIGSSFLGSTPYYLVTKIGSEIEDATGSLYRYDDYLTPHLDGARFVLPTVFFPITMPSFKDTVLYKNKMVGIDNDNPSRIFFSKNIINGTGPQFISTAYIYFNESVNGSVQYPTALAVLDNKLIIFTQDATYLTYGNFNDETRITSGIQNPEILTIETGCINPRSIVVSSNGITFWGKKGLYLLNRSMQAEMKNEVEFYKKEVVLDSVAILDRNEIRYYTDQRTVVWNYEFNTFSTIAEVRNSAIMLDNVIYSSFENKVLKQSDTYLSNETSFSMKFESEWYKFKDTQNFGRISRLVILGRKKGAHKLKISLAYDYNPSYVETHEIDNTSQAVDAIIQMRLVVKRQKCQSFRVKIEDISNGVDSLLNSIELISMTLEVGLKKGYNKLPASRKF